MATSLTKYTDMIRQCSRLYAYSL